MQINDRKPRKKAREQIPQSVRFNVFRRDNFTCRYCGKSSPDVVLHCDHAVSVKDGGGDGEDNLVTACIDCNLGKSSKSVKRELAELDSDEQASGLVGLWGHTFTEDRALPDRKAIQWQFKIIRKISSDLHMCQLFSWLDGEPTNCEVISTKTLLEDCKLYASNAQMLTAYEKECERREREIERAGGITALFERKKKINEGQFG